MYRAYKISINDAFNKFTENSDVSSKFDSVYREFMTKNKLKKMIKESSFEEGTLHADSIWDDWFPEIKADVFISHSSTDVNDAKKFANFLKEYFNLTSFIDSDIWGHADELLRDIDNTYCLNHGGETYDYKKRNASTAHVHMILSHALTRMIDKTECVIFLESDNSITTKDAVNKTYSPWIFHELATVDSITLSSPKRPIINKEASSILESFSDVPTLTVKYPVWGKRLIQIKPKTLMDWFSKYKSSNNEHALDVLSKITQGNNYGK